MPYFMGGGAETVALWMMEALSKKYNLTLFTFSDLNWEKLNKMYGTSLSPQLIEVQSVLPRMLHSTANFLIANNPHCRQFSIHLTLRYLKQKSHDYDLMISACNAADLGTPGIQYIHWVGVLEGGKIAKKFFYPKISGFSRENLQKNLSIANSEDVAKAVKEFYEIESQVIYPPAIIKAKDIPWEQKENAFICSGRLTTDKAPHKGIQILKAVREHGFPLKLFLTGGGGGPAERRYKHFVEKLVAENSDWIQLKQNLSYDEYCHLLYQCKYGIHPKRDQFGISVAEMVRAGIIPFVQEKGGQTEIVGKQNRDLFFNTPEEAVEKIIAVLNNENKQQELLKALEPQKILFSKDRFTKEITQVVDNYFLD